MTIRDAWDKFDAMLARARREDISANAVPLVLFLVRATPDDGGITLQLDEEIEALWPQDIPREIRVEVLRAIAQRYAEPDGVASIPLRNGRSPS